eukprot:1159742-Pelagomonas_calceolata.AAC.5
MPEAGEGEDGRMKSAIGIGALLMDGLGDTIRVSLTEDPELEIEPCRRLADLGNKADSERWGVEPFEELTRDIHNYEKRKGDLPVQKVGGAGTKVGSCSPLIDCWCLAVFRSSHLLLHANVGSSSSWASPSAHPLKGSKNKSDHLTLKGNKDIPGLNPFPEGEAFDFRGLLHRDGTVYNAVTPEELTKQPEVG